MTRMERHILRPCYLMANSRRIMHCMSTASADPSSKSSMRTATHWKSTCIKTSERRWYRTMTNDPRNKRRDQLEENARAALLKLFEHMGNPPSVQFPLDKRLWVRVEVGPDLATA